MVAAGKIRSGQPILICVPTGNFGNILAAYYARQCGLPVSRLDLRLQSKQNPYGFHPYGDLRPAAGIFQDRIPLHGYSDFFQSGAVAL